MRTFPKEKFSKPIQFFHTYKHAIPMLAYMIIYMLWFAHLEKTVTSHYRIIHVALDDYIPFCEVL